MVRLPPAYLRNFVIGKNMVIDVEFDHIEIVDGRARIKLKEYSLVISENSGIHGGINVVKDVKLDLISYLKLINNLKG